MGNGEMEQGVFDLDGMSSLMNRAVRSGNLEVTRWIHSIQPSECSEEALGSAVSRGNGDLAKWLYETFPRERFVDPWIASHNVDMIQWVMDEYEWKVEAHRVVWIDNVILSLIQKSDAFSFDQDVVVIESLYSVRSDFDRELYLNEVMPPRRTGYCDLPRYYPPQPSQAMDTAAHEGNLPMLKWLHEHRNGGCTTSAMDEAAARGHLDVVKWLHGNRTEGCTKSALSRAITYGHLDMVEWLLANRSEGCSPSCIDGAAGFDKLDVLQWLPNRLVRSGSYDVIDSAAHSGHFEVIKWLHEHRSKGCSNKAMEYAAEIRRLDIIKYLHRTMKKKAPRERLRMLQPEAMSMSCSGWWAMN